MADDTEGLCVCEECEWQGEVSECGVNGDELDGNVFSWLECPAPNCNGMVVEL